MGTRTEDEFSVFVPVSEFCLNDVFSPNKSDTTGALWRVEVGTDCRFRSHLF